jgi:hypothetical protein
VIFEGESKMVHGSCLCGQVEFDLDEAQAVGGFHCHCADCRRITGSGKASMAIMPQSGVTIKGDVKRYDSTGTEGTHLHRAFCPNCGFQLFTFVDEMPDVIYVKAGTMDRSDWINFTANFWGQSACSWLPVDGSITTFEKNPSA